MDNKKQYTLAELRKNHKPKLSQRELGSLLNMSGSSIAMYENGSRTPNLRRAREIAQFFGVSTDDIIFGKGAHDVKTNKKAVG